MKRNIIASTVLLMLTAFFGCGGGGDGGDPNAPASISLTPSKTVALANGSDTITLTANVVKSGGGPVADGTLVAFSAPGSAVSLSAASAATANGRAVVTATHSAVTGSNNRTVVVNATTGGMASSMAVKFINQPTSVDVSVAFSMALTNLASFRFSLLNTPGALFDTTTHPITLVNAAASGSSSLGIPVLTGSSLAIVMTSVPGFSFNTGIAPIIKATYAVTGTGLPAFSVDTTANFIAEDANGQFTLPQVGPSNVILTTVYNTEL